MAELCNDYGDNPACQRDADERYTMDFTDIGEGYIYWCSHCGPIAHGLNAALDTRFKNEPGFAGELREILDTVLATETKH